MKILGIETSCDETAAAVVEDGTKILSSVVASSEKLHSKTGGIIPEAAARQQIKYIIPVIEQALTRAGIKTKARSTDRESLKTNIDALAVTVGPGLIGSLLVGVETARTLSYVHKIPIIPVNHLNAHIYANWLEANEHKIPKFPALALVVSGGHTDLVLMKNHGKLMWIGGTRDDAAGEAFDKTARLLGLPYPGGPAISSEAKKYFDEKQKTGNRKLNFFPRPMLDKNNFDWSFSGLKTSVLRTVQSTKNIKHRIPDLSAEIQEAIVDSLVEKSIRAIKRFKPRSFLLAGGVAANKRLTEKFLNRIKSELLQVIFHVPPPNLCTDNATYIAACAYFNYHAVGWKKIKANPQLTILGDK